MNQSVTQEELDSYIPYIDTELYNQATKKLKEKNKIHETIQQERSSFIDDLTSKVHEIMN